MIWCCVAMPDRLLHPVAASRSPSTGAVSTIVTKTGAAARFGAIVKPLAQAFAAKTTRSARTCPREVATTTPTLVGSTLLTGEPSNTRAVVPRSALRSPSANRPGSSTPPAGSSMPPGKAPGRPRSAPSTYRTSAPAPAKIAAFCFAILSWPGVTAAATLPVGS